MSTTCVGWAAALPLTLPMPERKLRLEMQQIELTNTPIETTIVSAANSSLAYPLAAPEVVVQPNIALYVAPLAFDYYANPDLPLFGVKVTRIDDCYVLGLHWAHNVCDGAAFNKFIHLVSRVYAGGPGLTEEDWPDCGGHVQTDDPSRDMRRRWDSSV